MEKEKNNVEIFTEDNVITLFDDADKPVEFFEVAAVEYEEHFYELLLPASPIEGIEEDEAVIFEYTYSEDGNDKIFSPIDDEELLEKIFELYIQAAADFDASEQGGCGTDSGCSGCGCGCGSKK